MWCQRVALWKVEIGVGITNDRTLLDTTQKTANTTRNIKGRKSRITR